ncbi:hypothetical protein GGX14DRAFT_568199 [Mycena pura]|uniref:Uncharacterized protein n=1 Tax=Mycena pura TaxID=153505 RepID=A0AAD6YD65_9AGAR|nr:hypothetical protein GGX14DRAFT_568199 [Mycena pura]
MRPCDSERSRRPAYARPPAPTPAPRIAPLGPRAPAHGLSPVGLRFPAASRCPLPAFHFPLPAARCPARRPPPVSHQYTRLVVTPADLNIIIWLHSRLALPRFPAASRVPLPASRLPPPASRLPPPASRLPPLALPRRGCPVPARPPASRPPALSALHTACPQCAAPPVARLISRIITCQLAPPRRPPAGPASLLVRAPARCTRPPAPPSVARVSSAVDPCMEPRPASSHQASSVLLSPWCVPPSMWCMHTKTPF